MARSDDYLTSVLCCDFETALSKLSVLYRYSPNRRVIALVCGIKGSDVTSSNELVVIIRDSITNRWVGVRIPTISKILKYIASKKLVFSRKLSLEESARML